LKLDDKQKKIHKELWANLRNADLQHLDLKNKDLRYADLSGAAMGPEWTDLSNTDLGGATMACADLRNAKLNSVGLVGTHLEWAKLCNANLDETHLEEASLSGANLTDAALESVRMKDASLDFVDLSGAHVEIYPNSLPDVTGLAFVENLNLVRFEFSPASLTKIRDQLKTLGLREQEKAITAAIRRADMVRLDTNIKPETFVHGRLERIFNDVFFDWTCKYGEDSSGALNKLVLFFLLFALIYVVAQQVPGSRGGIWAVWDENRIHQSDGLEGPMRLTDGFPRSSLSDTRLGRISHRLGLNVFGLALWFSLLSACQIGWQSFNFGTWFSRMQPREYSLRATGWVRVASGIQSLISVYLIALWILTYFSTPFE